MKDGLEEFLKRIEAKPTNETLIDRFMTLVLEVDGVDRILYLKKLVGLLLNTNPYVALKAAYVELQEARKEKLTTEYEVGALKDVESCFIKLGRQENANLVREEINKLSVKLTDPALRSPPPKKAMPVVESPASMEFGGEEISEQQPIARSRASAPQDLNTRPSMAARQEPVDNELDIFDSPAAADPLLDEPLQPAIFDRTAVKRPAPIAFEQDIFGAIGSEADSDDSQPAEPFSRKTPPKKAKKKAVEEQTAVRAMPSLIEEDEEEEEEEEPQPALGYGTDMESLFLQMPNEIGKKPAPGASAPVPNFLSEPEPEAESASEEVPDIFSMNFEYTKRSKLPGLVDDGSSPPPSPAMEVDTNSQASLPSRASEGSNGLGNFSASSLFEDNDDSDDNDDDEGDGLPVVASPYFADSIDENDEPTNSRPRPRAGDPEGTAVISMESLQESKKTIESVSKSVAPEYEFRNAGDNDSDNDAGSPYRSVEEEDESRLYFAPDDDPVEAEAAPDESASMFRGSPPDMFSTNEVTAFLDLGALNTPEPEKPAPAVVPSAMAFAPANSSPGAIPVHHPAPVSQPMYVTEAPRVLIKEQIATDADWLQFQERLKMLSGVEVDRSHAVEFARRLLGATKETPEVFDCANLLNQFMEHRPNPIHKKKISSWLFEQLSATALHDLLASMTMEDVALRIYQEYLRDLFDGSQYRRLLRIVRDVTIEGLNEGWYASSFKYLPETWVKLGMEGFSWSEEEGGQAFCERVVTRENPGLALLLA